MGMHSRIAALERRKVGRHKAVRVFSEDDAGALHEWAPGRDSEGRVWTMDEIEALENTQAIIVRYESTQDTGDMR